MQKKNLFSHKRIMMGSWVAIMDHERHDRALCVSSHQTRCFKAGEIHEFLVCQETNPSSTINDVAYLGFGEFKVGGVLSVGDALYHDNEIVGKLLGFDETHFPNHYNIVFQSEILASGTKRKFDLGTIFTIYR